MIIDREIVERGCEEVVEILRAVNPGSREISSTEDPIELFLWLLLPLKSGFDVPLFCLSSEHLV